MKKVRVPTLEDKVSSGVLSVSVYIPAQLNIVSVPLEQAEVLLSSTVRELDSFPSSPTDEQLCVLVVLDKINFPALLEYFPL